MLRIARTKKSTYLSPDKDKEILYSQHQTLTKLIKKYLSAVTASVFAEPNFLSGTDDIDWYSDLNGQPEPLLSLSEEQQRHCKKLLSDRLNAISNLADQLTQLEPGSEDFQSLIKKAVQYPGYESVYVVNNQPIITFWGIQDPARCSVKTPVPKTTTAETLVYQRKRRVPRFLCRLVWLLLIVLLAGLSWHWFSAHPVNWQDYNPFIDEYQILLDEVNAAGDHCPSLEKIYNNNPLINTELDNFAQLKQQLKSRVAICEAYAELKKVIEQAQGNCVKLTEISGNNPYLKNPQEPFLELKQKLEKGVQLCAEYQQLKSIIDSAEYDCLLLSTIRTENPYLQEPEGMFILLKQQLTRLIQDCIVHKTLADSINKAQLDCDRLKQISAENKYLQDPEGKYIALEEQLGVYIKSCKISHLKRLPKIFGAEFVAGFATFTPKTKKRALREIKLIGTYLSKNKDATVMLTLHTPVSGPNVKNEFAYTSGLKIAKNVLDARFQSVVHGILNVPGVSRNQIIKSAFKYNKTNRVVRFSIN